MHHYTTGYRRVWLALIAGVFVLALTAPSASGDTVVVTLMNGTFIDDGECSVREAVEATNENHGVSGCHHDGSTGRDTIELPAGTASITGGANNDNNVTGDLDIKPGKGLTIVGAGKNDTKLDGDVDRVLDVPMFNVGPLTLRKLTVENGDANALAGGDVNYAGDDVLTLDRVIIQNGRAAYGGGVRVVPGFTSPAELVMDKSIVTDNFAEDSQGGAGIHAGTPVTITDSQIIHNHATGSFGPGGMRIEGGPSTITGTFFSENTTASGGGGAIEVTNGSAPRDLTIKDSLFQLNQAPDYRGGGVFYGGHGVLKVTRSVFSHNNAASGGAGLEAKDTQDTLKLSKSVVQYNTLASTANEIIGGAGVSADGTSTISKTEILGNTTESSNDMAIGYGGGIRNGGTMRITRSTISQNESLDFGGGIYADSGALTLSNTTISKNHSVQAGGGIRTALDAGLRVYNSTFRGNKSDSSSGTTIYADGTVDALLRGSIFHGDSDDCEGGSFVSKGYNVEKDVATCANGGPHDLPLTDPELRGYDTHGGPIAGTGGTATKLHVYALKKSSPARDLIPKRKCKDDKGKLKTDERSRKRPGGKKCDAGAFEI
jgi:hypothetical protein